MADASTSGNMSPELLKVVERAQREPEGRFHSLAHFIDVPALGRAFRRIRKDASAGVDGVTKDEYGQNLEGNLQGLHERLKTKQYRHQSIRRVHIPKDKGKTRPIGISTFEDRVVQDAVREVLEAIYEQDFMNCSYGFRPGRSAHDAIRALDHVVHRGEVNWILEADIVSFFDSLDRTLLMKMIEIRIADGSLLRLIGKSLHVGVLDGADYTEPEMGTIQGSGLSPLLGNIYLHYVLDQWFEREVKPRLDGKATLIRYADDLVAFLMLYARTGIISLVEFKLKPLIWVATSWEDLRGFPDEVRRCMGYALYLAQAGRKHLDAKPLKGFGGAGVLEVIEDFDGNAYRAVYTVKLAGVVYVLHAFQKKSKKGAKTSPADIDKVKARLKVAVEIHNQAERKENADEKR